MNAIPDAASLISLLPQILIYILPGYIGISLITEIMRRKIDTGEKFVLSCVFSYLIVALLRLVFDEMNIYLEFVVASVICIVLSWLLVEALQSNAVRTFLVDRMNYSPAKGAWEDSVDYEYGSWVRAKLKCDGRLVVGVLHTLGDLEKDPWLSLCDYYFFRDESSESPYYEVHGHKRCFIVNLSEVEYFELLPAEEGKKN